MSDVDLRSGLELLRARRWYAAHEALERAWLAATGDRRTFLQGLIHVAVAFEHLRRGNPRGTLSQWRKARHKLNGSIDEAPGTDLADWLTEITAFFASIDLEHRASIDAGDAATGLLPDQDSWPVPAERLD